MVTNFTVGMSRVSLDPCFLEGQLPSLSTSGEIDTLLDQGYVFNPYKIVLSILQKKIPLTATTLQTLMDREAICPPKIYEHLSCCIGTVDAIVSFLMSKRIYPVNPRALHLEEVLKAFCNYDSYISLSQCGCEPRKETLAYAGYCSFPSGVINHFLSTGLIPSAKILLDFLMNLVNKEEDLSFSDSFYSLVNALPSDVETTTEMLHVALENYLPAACMQTLCDKGAKCDCCTYVIVLKNQMSRMN